jgi:hypothetical protein
MTDSIVERVSRKAGVADLVEILAERLNASDLQSLLLAVSMRRACRLTFVSSASAPPVVTRATFVSNVRAWRTRRSVC